MNRKQILASLNEQLSLNENSKILVVGLGDTGYSVAKFLHNLGLSFAVTDSRKKPPFIDGFLQNFPDTPVFTGGFNQTAFDVATHLIVSPGISLEEVLIQKTILSGTKLISDIDIFSCSTNKPIIAITGSNGKSTVTTMLGNMGNSANKKTAIGGNLGTPALDLLNENTELYVLELSSFQLERTSKLNATAATVLNISADHIDRHGDITTYSKEKQRIFSGNGIMVLNKDDSIVKAMKIKGRKSMTFSISTKTGFHLETLQGEEWLMNSKQPLIRKAELPMEGLHNVANALAALALGTAVNLDVQSMCEALRGFKGLDHRMQKIANVKGVTWINDSKATNIGACIAALQGYQNKVILIAGGDTKGANIQELIPFIYKKTKHVILLGKDAELIDKAINHRVPSSRAKNIQEAVQIAARLAKRGESVLLSPACASLDQYKNYQERGEKFAAAVMELAA
ncbi:MAG: UDP-N-acetylmuramoyl-L-alanine--D-glutamate ligase [Methylococcaceae bacterium]|nr:UDP-N-acetylmuramoyl-L-alanine--D-glutamate ligase [Methylococcaceae bacterium]